MEPSCGPLGASLAPPRVYVGSFDGKPLNEELCGPMKTLFEQEREKLLADLESISKRCCDYRINEFVKRARAARIHARIITHLKENMPHMPWMSKSKSQQRLIDDLEVEFAKIQNDLSIPLGDFPRKVEVYRDRLTGYSFNKFEKLNPKLLDDVEDLLEHDIPALLKKFRNVYA